LQRRKKEGGIKQETKEKENVLLACTHQRKRREVSTEVIANGGEATSSRARPLCSKKADKHHGGESKRGYPVSDYRMREKGWGKKVKLPQAGSLGRLSLTSRQLLDTEKEVTGKSHRATRNSEKRH